MSDNKRITEKYIDHMNSLSLDMDKLWDKIISDDTDSNSDTDIALFEAAYEECVKDEKHKAKIKKNRGRLLTCAAAIVIVIIVLPLTMMHNETVTVSESSDSIAADEVFYENDDSTLQSEESGVILSSGGWDYSENASLGENVDYKTLKLAYSNGEIYNAKASADIEEEYFVESAVLKETELFLDGSVKSYEMSDSGEVVYEISVIHLVSDTVESLPETVSVYSDSCYMLLTGREYLLPIAIVDDKLQIVFENAPQIEFTLDREILYHNGWTSLESEEYATVSGCTQVYKDDYFYDRMNLTSEAALESLFNAWKAAKETQ